MKDLSWTGSPEFVNDIITNYTRPTPSVDASKGVSSKLEGNNSSIFEQGGSSGNVLSKPWIKFSKGTGCPNNTESARKPTVKYAEMYRNTSKSPRCGCFDHLAANCGIWVDKGETWPKVNYSQENMKYTSTHKSMTPRVVLLKSGTKLIAVNKPFSTPKSTLNVAQPKMTSFVKTAHSNVKRPFERKSVAKNQVWVPKVPTVRPNIPNVGSKVPTAKPTVATDKGYKGKAIKASAHWIWKPKENTSGQCSNFNDGIPKDNIDDKGYWDSGCSRHMTGNISYLSDYEPYDGGYVSFRHGGGKIIGKGTKEDVNQAVKESVSPLRFIFLPNLFYEAQMTTLNDAAKKSGAIPDNTSPQKEQEKEQEQSTELSSSPTVETEVPTISTPVPTISNVVSSENRMEDFFGNTTHAGSLNEEEADLSNMESTIQVSPTPTLRIHKDHPKSEIIGPVDTPPPGFEDPEYPQRVYKVKKAMYGLHQAPRAWYGTLSKYLLDNGFQRGTIDQTLFVRKHKGEFLLVQVYVDDIIFGSYNAKLCKEFETLMHDKFLMSAMGELNFFLGLQVSQKKDGIFLSQDKYVGDILKKFGYTDVRTAKTPMDRENH
ncbi:putative ribonuclease H-like domain-containing protein [Tanacetum coccineum]